ncbi:DUF4145 domain-containing protein [Bradyrhizobium sp. USDA 329]|uniref:DUF4145 domain-containing protein n=1 Tax=unclassified Bradyrhizobium TaxID=2631580 RepID=UPI0035174D05
MATFIIDCPRCKAKVAAEQHGFVRYCDNDFGMESKVVLGRCPSCTTAVVGRADEIGFRSDEEDGEHVVFSDVVRVYPDPPRRFTSGRIPRALNQSLGEADKSFQAGANIAACVMLGRALEALCRDLLKDETRETAQKREEASPAEVKPPRRVMLGRGIRELRDRKFIDERLYDWSMSLQAMRNLAAHPEDINVSRQDVEDLRAFVYAITEYVYDLTDRYNEFKEREAESKKPRPTAAQMFSGVLSKLPPQSS